jgi:hypothetical protein
MIRGAIILMGLVSAGGASAQWAGQQTAITNSASAYSILNTSPWSGSGETPTMRQQKLEQSDALRKEAAQLEVADGGTLSKEHAAYISKRAREILGGKRLRTGSLVATR